MTPQLRLSRSWGHTHHTDKPERWVLSHEATTEHGPCNVDLVVDRSWNGSTWNSYRVFAVDEIGHVREVLTHSQFLRHYTSYLEHEGEEPSDEWFEQWSMESRLLSVADSLRTHWEGMVDSLGLFAPQITR